MEVSNKVRSHVHTPVALHFIHTSMLNRKELPAVFLKTISWGQCNVLDNTILLDEIVFLLFVNNLFALSFRRFVLRIPCRFVFGLKFREIIATTRKRNRLR